MSIENGWPVDRDAPSTGLHREHSLYIPAHRHQVPFAFDVLKPSKQTLPISHHRFDDAEHRFGGLFAQPVEFPAPRRLEPMRHLLQRCRAVGWGFWRRGEALLPTEMMARGPHRDQRLDLGRHALLDVALTQIATVG